MAPGAAGHRRRRPEQRRHCGAAAGGAAAAGTCLRTGGGILGWPPWFALNGALASCASCSNLAFSAWTETFWNLSPCMTQFLQPAARQAGRPADCITPKHRGVSDPVSDRHRFRLDFGPSSEATACRCLPEPARNALSIARMSVRRAKRVRHWRPASDRLHLGHVVADRLRVALCRRIQADKGLFYLGIVE